MSVLLLNSCIFAHHTLRYLDGHVCAVHKSLLCPLKVSLWYAVCALCAVKTALMIDPGKPMPQAIKEANSVMGLPDEGPLPTQVSALLLFTSSELQVSQAKLPLHTLWTR